MKSYIHFALDMEYRRKGDEPSEPQRAFRHLQTKLSEKEEALELLL